MKIGLTLLLQQKALFNLLGNNINLRMPDSRTLIASNISEEQMINVTIITNYASNNANLHFDNVDVYLKGDLEPVTIYGFYNILDVKIQAEGAIAFTQNKNVYQPFINGFQGGITVNELCDKLSELSLYSPDTKGRVKNYTMRFGNCQCVLGGGGAAGPGGLLDAGTSGGASGG